MTTFIMHSRRIYFPFNILDNMQRRQFYSLVIVLQNSKIWSSVRNSKDYHSFFSRIYSFELFLRCWLSRYLMRCYTLACKCSRRTLMWSVFYTFAQDLRTVHSNFFNSKFWLHQCLIWGWVCQFHTILHFFSENMN